mgnify:CR=1 FL=1
MWYNIIWIDWDINRIIYYLIGVNGLLHIYLISFLACWILMLRVTTVCISGILYGYWLIVNVIVNYHLPY